MTCLLEPGAVRSPSPDALGRIADPDCNLAIWERPAPRGLAALLESNLRTLRFGASLGDFSRQLSEEIAAAGYPDSPACAVLTADIADLARRFAAIMKVEQLQARLAIVTTDGCRKFHGDFVRARLITTYVGIGTQWLDPAEAARVRNGAAPGRINTLAASDVGIFKGWHWTGAPAIHRSPPIAERHGVRLVLVLDPEDGG